MTTSATRAAPPQLHPLSGTRMTGAEIVVQVLADEGVDVIFGYSGGAILPTFDAIFRYNAKHVPPDARPAEQPMPLIVPANEQGAGFMAAGYARASGKVGVAVVTSGPGATNTVTPVRDCMADSIPLVVISGQVPTTAIGTDAFQEAPVSGVMGVGVAKHVFLVTDPTQLEATVRTAFEIARTGRPGPVVIDIPKDVQNWEGTFAGRGRLPITGYRKRLEAIATSRLDEERVAAFYEILSRSERPLIYAGGGVVNAGAAGALRALSVELGIPMVTTLMGIGAGDTRDELCLGMLGMHGGAFANYAVEDCDFLIAVGSRFDDRVAGKPERFAPNTHTIAHMDIDPSEIHKVKRVGWHYVGELVPALEALTQHARARGVDRDFGPWREELVELRRRHAFAYDRESPLIQPQDVVEAINQRADGRAIITTGVGQHQMWAAQYFDFAEPRLWLTSGSMGTMGFGLPAAIGAQFAFPDRLVIDFDGDASIRMNIGELETVTTYDLPVKVVVLNNFGDGMVKQWQKLFFRGRMSASDKSLRKKDFVKAAEADGFEWARRLEDRSQVDAVVDEFIRFPGPAFLEVVIDPDAGVYPMVGPGQSYDQMITGDFIEGRPSAPESTGGADESGMF